MKPITSSNLKDKIFELKHEPTRVMSLTLELLERAAINGEAFVVDPSQPLPFLVENDVVLAHAAVEAFEANTMRQYPVMAQNESDLFLHVSDIDMVGMFAVPGETDFVFMLSKAEVVMNAVNIPGTQSKKLTIPRHTQILINGLHFTMQYPITMLIKPHGGMEINYEDEVDKSIQNLGGTKLDWDILKMPSSIVGNTPNEYIRITTPVKQMRLSTHKASSSPVTMFKKSYVIEDQFCHANVYMETNSGWKQVKVTHSENTFDPFELTMQLKVIGNVVTVELPYIYQVSVSSSATFRVDLYTTKGSVFMDLSGLRGGFEVRFQDLGDTDKGRYYAPMSKMDTFAVLSTGAVDGGKDIPSFMERRGKILTNTIGEASKPITPSQLENTINTLGFDVTLNHDDVIGRTYQVSRGMDTHHYGLSTSPVDSATMTARSSVDELVLLDTVKDNYEQLTIMPSTLYQDIGGVLAIVPDDERVALEDSKGDLKVKSLVYNRYLYTPLHYVLDFDNNKINVRPYHLSYPKIKMTGYSASNESIEVFVRASTNTYIEYDSFGYVMTVVSDSNTAYQALSDDKLIIQLAFKPDIESEWVYINGEYKVTLESGERVFQFRLATEWVVRDNHQLALTNFTMRVDEPQIHDTPLDSEWFLIWGVADYNSPGMTPSPVDALFGRHLLPNYVVGIYRESLNIHLGDELTNLWRRSRPMAGAIDYLTYDYDIPKTYTSNVYQYDEDGMPVVVEEDCKKRLVLLHAIGDPVMEDGEPVLLYSKGQVVRDEYGELIPKNSREVVYWWDVVLFDAQYRYATRELDQDYTRRIADTLVEWVNETLKPVREMAAPRTEFNFHPRNSLKYINALVDDGRVESIYTAQRLIVNLYLNDQSFKEAELREGMINGTKEVLQGLIGESRISKDELVSGVMAKLGDDVVTLSISGLGGADYEVITLIDATDRLCIAKVLSLESDGKLSIKDDVIVNFYRHGI